MSEPELFWFYIEPFIYINKIGNLAFFYNTLNHTHLIQKTETKNLMHLIDELIKDENSYCITLTGDQLKDKMINGFVKKIRRNFFGDLLPVSDFEKRPFTPKPSVVVNELGNIKSVNDLKSFVNLDVIKYLKTVKLIINNRSDNINDRFCGIQKQVDIPVNYHNEKSQQINIRLVEKIFQEIAPMPLQRIDILGGNVLDYRNLGSLIQILEQIQVQTAFFHVDITDFVKANNAALLKKFMLNLYCYDPAEFSRIDLGSLPGKNTQIFFLIRDLTEYRAYKNMLPNAGKIKASFIPYYSDNDAFFQTEIFKDTASILHQKLNMNDIFMRRTLNPLDFGTLYIDYMGDCYSNLNSPRLDNLKKSSISDCIITELRMNYSWRKTRHFIDPCKDCILNCICPPVSSYEYAMGRHNLCHFDQRDIQ